MADPSLADRYDLHTHSTVSDGTTTPSEVVAEAAALGLAGLALTDHDTTDGWAEARTAAAATGIDLLPGLELTTKTDGFAVHLLAYGVDPGHPGLLATTARIRASRLGRAEEMVRRLGGDYALDWDEMRSGFGAETTVGRPHIADALVRQGYFPDRGAAFQSVLHPGSPYYVKTYAVDTAEGIALVRDAGGLPVLAHPAASRQRAPVPVAVLEFFAAAGLWGVELDHPENLPEWLPPLREAAARLGLAVTGASDYHGAGKANRLGERSSPAELVARIRAEVATPR